MANGTAIGGESSLEDSIIDAKVLVSQSLIDSVILYNEIEGAPFTVESLKVNASKLINGKIIPKGFMFEKNTDANKYRQRVSEHAQRLALKTAVILWNNTPQYDAITSLDNLATVTSDFDLPTTGNVIHQLDELMRSEKKTFSGTVMPTNLNIVPYFFENVLPRLKGTKTEERIKNIEGLVKEASGLIYQASKDTRLYNVEKVQDVQQEIIARIEEYASSIGLKRKSNGSQRFDFETIKLYVTNSSQKRQDLTGVSIRYTGILDSDHGTVKVFNGTGEVTTVDINGKRTREEANILATFGERLLSTSLTPGTGQYTDTRKAVNILKQKHA